MNSGNDLKGFKAKNMAHRIVVMMFADDMMVYLSEKDKFKTLTSGAHFNTSKMEVIPIGTKEYHNEVISSKKISPHEMLPESIEIAKEGKVTRILGAWISNGIEEQAIWSPILDRIEKTLTCWEKWHPTIEGRKIIVERTIGSMTQYLTTAQGMPKEIEELLNQNPQICMGWGSKGRKKCPTPEKP
ncbi:hypothetical protein EV424DRAFT_1475095 [Suillus variegatus]|nr:hypothetical protein EV424DRAFT_1475095 [Suillus variegatus]